MMPKQEIIAVLLVIICPIVIVWAAFSHQSILKQANTVQLSAQAPEKGNFSPQTIKIKKGKEITLMIRNVDVTSHGFIVPLLGIRVKEIKAGELEKVTFTIDEAGKYPFYCSVWCSDYHMQMRGTLIVE
ncbi:MAG: cupredoxin domain-containing protein [Desulfobacterales bacterium]|nr:cupredoxin domain-containing protein [Desulfobacterales bacterium]